ncbi:MAG: hypothetical protein ABJL71_18860 [Cyclobacteriaceae bacterium]
MSREIEIIKTKSHTHLSFINRVIQDSIKQREDQILKHLKDHGYEFETRADLGHFAKTRCTLEKYPHHLNVLRADGKYICEWWDTSRFENDGERFTCIIGEPPTTYSYL